MANHDDIAIAFMNKKKLKGTNMFTKNGTIYSWGEHFPIATHLKDGSILLNGDHYSSSTSKHQAKVRMVIDYNKNVIQCSTKEIQNYLDNPNEPIIITRTEYPQELRDIMLALKTYCKNKGIDRFPMKKLTDQIEEMIVINNI